MCISPAGGPRVLPQYTDGIQLWRYIDSQVSDFISFCKKSVNFFHENEKRDSDFIIFFHFGRPTESIFSFADWLTKMYCINETNYSMYI